MKVKNTDSPIRLHRMADIKSVSQSPESPNTLYIEGYASFYQNSLGIKEVDRDQEIVNIDGLDITAYQKNPVLLWNHDWDEVRGKVVEMRKDPAGLYVRCEMQRLTGKEADFENVLYGNVKSFSIGFIPMEYQYLDNAVEITQSEMIELSIAPVQSNRSALFQVVGTKSLDVDNAGLRKLLEPSKKETNMEIDLKVKNPDEGQNPTPVTPVEAAPAVQASVDNTPVVTPEVKVEVKNDLNVEELAKQIAAANAAAEKIKADAAEAAAKAEADRIQAEKDAAEQKVKDVLDFINNAKESVLSIQSFDELNDKAEELNKIIEPITTASEAIIAKVIELSKSGAGIAPANENPEE